MNNEQINTLLLKGYTPTYIANYGQVSKDQVQRVIDATTRRGFKVYHLNILDSDEARDELNDRETGGWSSQPRFTRYADITTNGDLTQASLAWLVGEYTCVAHVDDWALDDAFRLTNHIESSWTDNDKVIEINAGLSKRSTSVGDIIQSVNNGKLFMVASFGFKEIDPIALAKRSTLDELI